MRIAPDTPAAARYVAELVHSAAREAGATVEDVLSERRRHEAVDARYAIYHVLTEDHQWGLAAIGRVFERDHSSIHHGVAKARNLVKVDRQFAVVVAALRLIETDPAELIERLVTRDMAAAVLDLARSTRALLDASSSALKLMEDTASATLTKLDAYAEVAEAAERARQNGDGR